MLPYRHGLIWFLTIGWLIRVSGVRMLVLVKSVRDYMGPVLRVVERGPCDPRWINEVGPVKVGVLPYWSGLIR